jgi:hypothetical protein
MLKRELVLAARTSDAEEQVEEEASMGWWSRRGGGDAQEGRQPRAGRGDGGVVVVRGVGRSIRCRACCCCCSAPSTTCMLAMVSGGVTSSSCTTARTRQRPTRSGRAEQSRWREDPAAGEGGPRAAASVREGGGVEGGREREHGGRGGWVSRGVGLR